MVVHVPTPGGKKTRRNSGPVEDARPKTEACVQKLDRKNAENGRQTGLRTSKGNRWGGKVSFKKKSMSEAMRKENETGSWIRLDGNEREGVKGRRLIKGPSRKSVDLMRGIPGGSSEEKWSAY